MDYFAAQESAYHDEVESHDSAVDFDVDRPPPAKEQVLHRRGGCVGTYTDPDKVTCVKCLQELVVLREEELQRTEKERYEALVALGGVRSELEQTRAQLAGCGAAALGYGGTCKKGDFGWSASFGDVMELREKLTKTEAELEQTRAQLGDWRATAEVLADPVLAKELKRPLHLTAEDVQSLTAALAQPRPGQFYRMGAAFGSAEGTVWRVDGVDGSLYFCTCVVPGGHFPTGETDQWEITPINAENWSKVPGEYHHQNPAEETETARPPRPQKGEFYKMGAAFGRGEGSVWRVDSSDSYTYFCTCVASSALYRTGQRSDWSLDEIAPEHWSKVPDPCGRQAGTP